MGCFDSCMKCLGRIPYASLIATIMCMMGVGVFCGTMYKAVENTLMILTEIFDLDVTGLSDCHTPEPNAKVQICDLRVDIVQKVFIAIGVTMGVVALILLLVGFLSTGATRDMVYSGARARCGGRCSLAFFMVITYFLNFIWLILASVLVVMTAVFGVTWKYCDLPHKQNAGEHDMRGLNLTQWAFIFGRNDTSLADDGNERFIIMPPRYTRFCTLVTDAFPFYLASFCASILILKSLVHFLICIAANYAHIKDGQKLQEYEEARYLEEQELGSMAKN